MTVDLTIQLNDPALTHLGINSLIDFYLTISIDRLHLPGLDALVTGVNSPFLNVVIDTQTKDQIDPAYIRKLKAFFDRHHVPWVWLKTSISRTDDLTQQGFNLVEEAPSMYFDLTQSLPPIHSKGKIIEVTPNDDLFNWIKPIIDGFPSEDNGDAFRILNENLLHQGNIKLKHFVSYLENEPVASATLFLSKEAVMLHNLATKQALQKQGLGKALALYRMHLAKDLGYLHCFLDASDLGYELHKSLGFKVYSTIKAYQINL